MRLFLFAISLFLSCNLLAQDYITYLSFYGPKDGLSHREVKSIYQDSRGFMWFSTPAGLNRFDGYDFDTFSEKDGLQTSSLFIEVEDLEGYLWLTTVDTETIVSITLLHIVTKEIIDFKEKFGANLPFKLEDIWNEIRVSPDGGVYFVDKRKKNLIAYYPDSGFSAHQLEFQGDLELIFFSSPTTIWANLGRQEKSRHYRDTLIEIDIEGRTLHQYTHNGYLGADKFTMVGDELWYFEEGPDGDGRFFRIDKNRKRWSPETDPLKLQETLGQMPYFLKLDYNINSETIVALNYDQRAVIDPKRGIVVDLNQKFPVLKGDRAVGDRGICIDNRGRHWLGGNFGVYKLNVQKSPFTLHLFKDLDQSQGEKMGVATRAILEYDNEIYVATEGKDVIKLNYDISDETSPELFPIDNINDYCWSLGLTRDGQLFAGCHPYVFQLFPESNQSAIIRAANNTDIGAWSIYEDKNGTIWLGDNWRGLKTLDRSENIITDFDGYNGFDELRTASVLDIREDRHNNIWLSTSRGFYAIDIDKGIVARYWSGGKDEFYIPSDSYHHFYHDKDGIYWLATSGKGLIRWDKDKQSFEQFTTSNGLPNNVIYGIYEDDYEKLWLSSEYGIIQFDKKTFQSRSFLMKDGITHEEFNRISHYQDKAGTIYFGGLNGVTAFHPKDFQFWDSIPDYPLRITGFQQFDDKENKLVDKTGELILTKKIKILPRDRFFQLDFALLTFENTDQIRYAYKIEGIDKDWLEQKDHSLRLSRLPYGNHQLRVKGQASNGKWSANELDIQLSVIRPFYLQAWFFALSILLISAIGYWLYTFNLTKKLSQAEAKRLTDLDSLKTRLYTYISHEFRTPLTVIMGMADNISGQPEEKTMIKRNSRNLLHLVNQLLDLSKIDAGGIRINYVQGNIVAFLRYLTESFHMMAMEKNIALEFKSDYDSLLMDFDEVRMQQVVYNLISNAIKFTPEGGTVSIKLSTSKQFRLDIEDTGVGIEKAKLKHIFDRFYQIDSSSTRRGEGTGIGLSLTRELVQLMDGAISVKSEPGKGTIFSVFLPIKNEAPFSDDQSMLIEQVRTNRSNINLNPSYIDDGSLLADLEQPRLLIVEDHKDVAAYIRSCVQPEYKVYLAQNGEEGLVKALDIIPDIVISDVMMPEMDGYEFTQKLKTDERTSHIPVILLTAKASIGDKIQGLDAGADAYLSKPFHKEELIVRLKKLIELRRRLQIKYADIDSADDLPKRELSLDEAFLHKLHRLVTREIGNSELRADDLCNSLALSQAQLYRKVKALTGKTPALFIRSIRLAKAVKLLKSGKLNVSEVAYDVGFSDPNYFSRIFTKEFGQPPSSFIKN